MCEWLSCAQWCDIRLFCGGHTFTAHRAVLASVSTYLREVLLSCPAKDSPAYIILPDFDPDAVSSVLYYIYHGEVVIQRSQLNEFLDIIRNFNIYIDPQCLFKISDGKVKSKLNLSSNMYQESDLPKNDDIMSLDSKSGCRQYGNVKKGIENIVCKVQCSFDGLDFEDKQIRRTRSEKFGPSARDLVARWEDRQRGSLLRDLFIETYARNGNGNGLGAGVPAISNENYRGTSVLFTNANVSHPNDILAETHKIMPELGSFTSPMSNTALMLYEKYMPLNNYTSESFIKSFMEASNSKVDVKFLTENRLKQGLWMENFNSNYLGGSESSPLDLRMSIPKTDAVDCVFEKKKCEISNYLMKEFNKEVIAPTNNNIKDLNSKTALINKVLESPWCPRLPYYYKPFRRKTDESIKENIKNHLDAANDKNNNINKLIDPLATTEETKKSLNSEIRDAPTSRSQRLSARDDLKCTICNQVFTSEESFSTHMRRHSSVTRYSCGECYKSFSQLRNFKYHMSVHRGTKEFATTCPICGKYFNDRGYLSSHMKIHRNRKEYKCSMCPKSFNQRVAYNMHVRIHTGVKPHVCAECGKAFSRKMLLKQHQRTHSGERPYACPHCDRRFADRSNMTLHLRLHTGVKPFSCSLCPKSFTKKHHLKSHLNFHTGAKPYSCPRCKLAFTQSSNMRTHLKKCNAPDATSLPVDSPHHGQDFGATSSTFKVDELT